MNYPHFSRILVLLIAVFFGSFLTRAQEEEELIFYPFSSDSIAMQEPAIQSHLNVALVLSDIYSKKDMEFSRGFFMGIDNAHLPDQSLTLKLLNGEVPSDSLIYQLDAFEPDVVVATDEKELPAVLINYCSEHGTKLINVFDARSTAYTTNPEIYQILTPSNVFNNTSSQYLSSQLSGNVLVIIGEPDPNDAILKNLILQWPDEDLILIEQESIKNISLSDNVNYTFYPSTGNAKEIKEIMSELTLLASEFPLSGFNVVGRPTWVALNDFNSMIANMEVYIPAKCYFYPGSAAAKKFITEYNERYSHPPIKSYPVYAAMGYDVASYFLPILLDGKASDNYDSIPAAEMLQIYFDMGKASDYAGFHNQGTYLLHFEPWGTLKKEKITLF